MKSIIPYEKEINFDTKISEITSISLEYEADIKDGSLEGNFFLEGEYKIHEVSVNKEPFKYKLPFIVELGDNLNLDTLKHDISNFTYDIVNDSILKVNIDLLIEGEEKIVEIPTEEERKGELIEDDDDEEVSANDTSIDDILDNLDLPLNDAPLILDEEKTQEIKKEYDTNDTKIIKDEEVDQSIVLNNALNSEDTYITYHIHIIKEDETLDTIATSENISKEIISDCNDITNLTPGVKLIIPTYPNE